MSHYEICRFKWLTNSVQYWQWYKETGVLVPSWVESFSVFTKQKFLCPHPVSSLVPDTLYSEWIWISMQRYVKGYMLKYYWQSQKRKEAEYLLIQVLSTCLIKSSTRINPLSFEVVDDTAMPLSFIVVFVYCLITICIKIDWTAVWMMLVGSLGQL